MPDRLLKKPLNNGPSVESVLNSQNSKYVIYFDWILDGRAGGPPGYLYNLKMGLEKIEQSQKVYFAVRSNDCTCSGHNDLINKFSNNFFLSKTTAKSLSENYKSLTSQKYESMCTFLSRHDYMCLTPSFLQMIEPQRRHIIHVHTSIDAVKVHNSLVRHGARHTIKIVLTSHCPEMPAKEASEIAYSEGLPRNLAESYYFTHLEVDMLAFRVSDVIVFPCVDSLEPYYASSPYKEIFRHKDIRFMLTGVPELTVSNSYNVLNEQWGAANKFIICFAGRHNSIKGYDRLIDFGVKLLDKNDDIFIYVLGRKGPIASPEHDRWVEVGWTDNPGHFISAADVFVLPNLQTYFDLILLEALSVGAIVVTSNTGGNKFFANNFPGIFLCDSNSEFESIILKIKAMSKDEREHLSKENRELYKKIFTVENFARSYIDLLESIDYDYKLSAPHKYLDINIPRNKPEISVIVPVFNAECYLEECLNSIANQTFENFEVIVVNDGSIDNSMSIIQNFLDKDSRFKCVSITNSGLSVARNEGLKIASGTYISFVDSDDYIHKDMLRLMHTSCLKNKTKLAVCSVNNLNREGDIFSCTSFLQDDCVYPFWHDDVIDINLQTVTSLYPSAWNKLYHSSLFQNICFDAGLYYEDHPVFYKIFLSQPTFSYVNYPLYIHRDSGPGRITMDGSRKILDIFVVFDTIYSIFLSKFLLDAARPFLGKILTRLVWERTFTTPSPSVKLQLFRNAVMRFNTLRLTCCDAQNYVDPGIDRSFVEDIFKTVNTHGGLDNYDISSDFIKEYVVVKDVSKSTHRSHFDIVHLDINQNYILIHPILESVTICEITGLGTFGSVNIKMTVCTENALAGTLEFIAFVSPFIIKDPDKYLLRNKHDSSLGHSDWLTLEAMKPIELTIPITHSCPSMAIYLCSRIPKGGSMDYAWLRVRNLVVELID